MTTIKTPERTADGKDWDDWRPAPVRLRTLQELTVEGRWYPAGFSFVLDPGVDGAGGLMTVATNLVRDGKAEVVGARPGWLPKQTITMRALAGVVVPSVGERRRGDVFEYPCESRDDRQIIIAVCGNGTMELVQRPLPAWWPRGAVTSTLPSNRSIDEPWAAH